MADKRISQLIERTDIANNDVLPIVASGATTTNKVTISTIQTWMQDNLDVGVTSVGLSMPSAFVVSNSPVTASGNITVTGAGTVAQYIRGDGSLADFPQSAGGGGASVSYYLNGSVSQGTIGGIAYLEMNKTPILAAGTDFTINADGYIASFITDAGDPGLLEIPAGNWNFETYLSATSGGGSPTFYIELYKVNSGGTATLIASNSATPESISLGTNINPYFSALAVPTTTLALTDRLALRYYVTHAGRTITLHTENSHLCQIITTFTTGLTALNGLTAQVQNFATGTSGTDFNINSAGSTHTFNMPSASATARGLVTTGSQTIAGAKTFSDDAVINGVNVGRGASSVATNTRLGFQTLTFNTTGSSNTTVGWNSLYLNTTGSANSSFGTLALENNTTGGSNTALGYEALKTNTTGGNNTAVGFQALRSNTGNGANTAVGNLSLWNNTAGLNTALGHISLYSNTTGEYNVGLGIASLYNNTTGSYNIAIGDQSGQFISGGGNNIISNNSLFIGTQTRALGNNQTNQIVIGHYAIGNGSNTVTIGNDSITSNIFSGNLSTRRAVGTASEGIIELRPNTGSSNIIIASGAVPLHILSTSGSLGLGVGNTPQVTIASGGAVTLTGNLTANSFIKTGGTSSQFLKADGSVDSSTYLTTGTAASTYLPLTGGILTGGIALTSGNLEIAAGNGAILFNPANSQYFQLYTNSSNELNFGYGGTSPVVAKIGSSGAVTLTGALTGTSATFAGRARFQGTGYDTLGSAEIMLTNTTASTGRSFIVNSSNAGQFLISDVSAGQTRLSINSSGAVTLTGALSGTSASFTGNGAFSGVLQVAPTTGTGMIGVGDNFGGNMNAGIYRGGIGVTTAGNYLNVGGFDGVVITTGNAALGSQTPRLTISSTGAATFSSTARIEGQFLQVVNATQPSVYINNTAVQWRSYLNSNNYAISDAVRDVLTLGYNGSPSFFQGCNVAIGATSTNGRLGVRGTTNDSSAFAFEAANSSGNSLFLVRNDGNASILTTPITSNSVVQSLTINSGTSGKGLYFSSGLNVADQYVPIGMQFGVGNENNKAEMRMAIDGADGSTRFTFHTVQGFGALTERMRITSGGNVLLQSDRLIGLNTSDGSDSGYLAIAGAGGDGANRAGHIYLSGNERAVDAGNIVIAAGNISSGAGSPGTIVFRTGDSTERMRITSGGSVIVGQSYMTYPVSIEAQSGGGQLALTRSGAVAEFYMGGTTGGGTQLFVRSGGSGGVRLDAGSTGWVSASDLRLKDIEKPIENAVENLSTLQTVYYSWKDSEDKSLHLGLIAQEVEEVYPELVSESSIDETKGVKYTELIPVLVAAIKELKAEIESLKSQING